LANTKSAKKQVRASERKRVQNRSVKTLSRTTIDKAEVLITGGDLEKAKAAVALAVSTLDAAAGKGVIHPNNAARRKSRLLKKLNTAAPAPAKTVRRKTRATPSKKTD